VWDIHTYILILKESAVGVDIVIWAAKAHKVSIYLRWQNSRSGDGDDPLI